MNLEPLGPTDIDRLDFAKGGGLIPAVVQDATTGAVLMLGYMNREALRETFARRKLVFFSRSKQRLWEKGETSGHTLVLADVRVDCDSDTLLVTARPRGPACHLGTTTCFGDEPATAAESLAFLAALEAVIAGRVGADPESSYTARLFARGPERIAQKIGEEGVELALAVASQGQDKVIAEAADLLFHLLVALRCRDVPLLKVIAELRARHKAP